MSLPAPEPASMPSAAYPGIQDRSRLPLTLGALIWALVWMALEAWFTRRGVGPVQQALAPLGVCLLLAAGLILVTPALGRRLAASDALPRALVGVLLLALAAGRTVVSARAWGVPPGGLLGLPFSILATARTSDLFRSLWLEALLLPLGAWALAAARAARPDLRPHPARILLLAGLLLLAVGALLNRALGLRSDQVFTPGGSARAFEPHSSSGAAPLRGLRLRLDALDAAERAPAFCLAVEGFATPWTVPVESGQVGDLPGGLRYQVEKLIPEALPSGQVAEDPQGPENPALQVMLGLGKAEPLVGVLFARDPEGWRRDEPEGRFAVVYRERFDPALLQGLRPHPPTDQKLVLTFMGKTLEHRFRPGGTWNLPGFSLTVAGLYPDFGGIRKGPDGKPELFSRSSRYRNPWLLLRLRQASGGQADLLLSARSVPDQDYHAYLARTLPPGMTLRYVPEGAELQDRFVLLTREDGKVRLVEGGRVTRTAKAIPNRPFVVEKGLSVTVQARYDRARFEPDFVPDPEVDVTASAQRPVLRLRVWDPATGGAESRWLQARGANGGPVDAAFLGGRIRLAYQPKAPDPRDLRGTLVVLGLAETELARGVLTVQAPFVFRSHRFYLDGRLPGLPASIRILATTDPGLGLAWAGLACLVVGLLAALLGGLRRPKAC